MIFGIDWLWLDFGSDTNHMNKRIQSDLYCIKLPHPPVCLPQMTGPDLLIHDVIRHRDNV